jgi:hypothetical protein
MRFRVRTIGVGSGTSEDLTDGVSGLQFSSTNPGGDERATFRLSREWITSSPELLQGNALRIEDGLARLWSGRIEEVDRAVDSVEHVQVTCYGLGIRLKDDESYSRVWVDRDPAAWGDMPFNEKVAWSAVPAAFDQIGWASDDGGLVCALPTNNSATIGGASHDVVAEAWYTMPTGLTVAKVQYIGTDTSLPASWLAPRLTICANDDSTTREDYSPTFDSTLRTVTASTPRRYAFWRHYSNGAAAVNPAAGSNRRVSKVAVYGNHGLTTRAIDSSTPDGLYGGDMVSDIVSGVTGITAARIDAPTTVIPHAVQKDPGTREDALRTINSFFGYDWGTTGPTSVLDTSTTGYFYWKAPDLTTAHWFARRADCDDVALNVELAQLYNAVIVTYQDPTTSGTQTVTRTATVHALNGVGLTRTARIDGGTLTLAGAQTLGDAFLQLTGQQSPARGSVTLSQPISHYQRGVLPPWHMRADGANLRLPDVLPSKDALSLSAAPDRRTTFPIKRVSVEASGQTPKVTVDVDQANDRLSVLQARLALAAQFPNGSAARA